MRGELSRRKLLRAQRRKIGGYLGVLQSRTLPITVLVEEAERSDPSHENVRLRSVFTRARAARTSYSREYCRHHSIRIRSEVSLSFCHYCKFSCHIWHT